MFRFLFWKSYRFILIVLYFLFSDINKYMEEKINKEIIRTNYEGSFGFKIDQPWEICYYDGGTKF
jgi:hypothetical protein